MRLSNEVIRVCGYSFSLDAQLKYLEHMNENLKNPTVFMLYGLDKL